MTQINAYFLIYSAQICDISGNINFYQNLHGFTITQNKPWFPDH